MFDQPPLLERGHGWEGREGSREAGSEAPAQLTPHCSHQALSWSPQWMEPDVLQNPSMQAVPGQGWRLYPQPTPPLLSLHCTRLQGQGHLPTVRSMPAPAEP